MADDMLGGGVSTMHQNADGLWMPAVPLPLFGLRKRCRCGRRFWTLEGYRAHYALDHILRLVQARRFRRPLLSRWRRRLWP